jgi:integrase
VVSVNVPAVFPPGEPLMLGSSQHWLIVHRQDAAALLLMIQQVQNKAERSLGTVCGAIRLEGRYDWDTLVLDPIVSRMVRRDFQLFFEREKWFRKHNLPYRRGYLFYGNSGNGKTAVIRVMAAHPHIRPYAVDLSDGDNQSSQLVALFEQASRNTPALVILEDLDRAFPTEGKRTRCYNREEQPSFKADDVRRIIAASEAPYDTIWRLAAETGIRRGELCGLNVGDVDLANQIIIVKRSVSKKRTLKSPKNGKARMFALSPQLTEQLKRYADRRGADEPLFLSKMGKRLEPDNFVKRHLKPILKNLGLQGAAHAFRHGNATLLDSLRTPMKVRQDRLGHADPKTTMLYTHSISGDERSTAQQLGALLEQEFLAQDCPKLIPETRMAPESNSEAVAN